MGAITLINWARQADLYPVGIAHQRIKNSADQQGVFQVVDLLQQMRGLLAVARSWRRRCGRDTRHSIRQRRARAFWATACVRCTRSQTASVSAICFSMLRFMATILRTVSAGFFCGVSDIAMQRKRIDILVALLQNFAVPFQIGGHPRTARSAGDELQRRINGAHLPGRILGLHAVLGGGNVPDLPGPVHLISQAPVLDVVRLRALHACAADRSTSCPAPHCNIPPGRRPALGFPCPD